jgi:putative membrane protein
MLVSQLNNYTLSPILEKRVSEASGVRIRLTGPSWLDHRMTVPDTPADPPPSPSASDVVQRTSMAAERTWLAWWRTALTATAGSLAVGRLAPELLDVAPWPYVVLGAGYASLAIGLLVMGALRQRDLQRAIEADVPAPLSFRLMMLFTVGGVLLALLTVVLVIAQT